MRTSIVVEWRSARLPAAVNWKHFRARPPGTGSGFLFAARLSAEKGLDLLLSAWQRHPVGALGELRIVGDGPLRSTAEAAAAARADVTFLGPIDHARVREEMRAAYLKATRYEWMFWDSAYRLEAWPV